MARKDDILNIYTKEVEGIKEAGLFKGEAPFVSPQGARDDGRWKRTSVYVCEQLSGTWRQSKTDRSCKAYL